VNDVYCDAQETDDETNYDVEKESDYVVNLWVIRSKNENANVHFLQSVNPLALVPCFPDCSKRPI
jgi:hypothetical protein